MHKGIFWCYVSCFDDDIYSHQLLTVMVDCEISGKTLEETDFSSKSGENFNHKSEWEKRCNKSRRTKNKPFDYYPRGRVEIKNGKIRIFANPVIIEDDEAKALIVKSFELEDYTENISWVADNSKHYHYAEDAMSGMLLDD